MSEILQFKITLDETNPAIWRRLQVPQDMTFLEFHIGIQITMGWTNSHLFEFYINETTICLPNEEDVLDIHENETIDAGKATLKQYLLSQFLLCVKLFLP